MRGRQAVAIVLVEQGRMLLIRRAEGVPRPGYWSPPTGWVEPGESPAEAAVREAKEELGLEVCAEREVWHCHSDDGRLRIDWWQVTRIGGELRPAPAEVAAHCWVDPASFFDMAPTFPQHHGFFRDRLPSLVGAPPGE